MNYEFIVFEVQGDIATIKFNRPEARNALNEKAWKEVKDAIAVLNCDDNIKIGIFTGVGEKAFVAGADIKALKDRSMLETLIGENQTILKELEQCEKPTIAAVNGVALGGGCELALACDIRIASDNSKFGLPELNLGFIPGAGGTQRLARVVGLGRAKEMILTGKIIDAHTALNYGLVSKVVPLNNLYDETKVIAEQILSKGPIAVRLAKKVLNVSLSTDQSTGQLFELFAQSILFGTHDKNEGITAYLEKRSPEFKNI